MQEEKADAMTGVLKYYRTTWGSTLCSWSLLPSSFSGILLGGPQEGTLPGKWRECYQQPTSH